MSQAASTALQKHLSTFIVPYAESRLGEGGSEFTVSGSEDALRVHIKLGFPAGRCAPDIVAALRVYCEQFDFSVAPEFSVTSSIQAHSVQHGLKPLEGISNVVAVASGKGGVGKSTIAVNLALALAQEGASVGILDADIYGPSQPRMLGLTGERPATHDGKTLEPLEAHGIKAMSIGFLVDDKQPMAWRGPMVTSALNQLLTDTRWDGLDYLIVDMPPGTGDIQLTLSQQVPVSGAIIVTTPQEIALADARKGLEMFLKVNVPVLGIVENMSIHVCSQCGHEEPIFGQAGGSRLAEEYELPLLGALPLDGRIGAQTDQGTPSVVAEPDGAIAQAYRGIAIRAAAQLAVTGKDYSNVFPTITVEQNG
jgi:ATP-binding protein involved in chromosome partitioning